MSEGASVLSIGGAEKNPVGIKDRADDGRAGQGGRIGRAILRLDGAEARDGGQNNGGRNSGGQNTFQHEKGFQEGRSEGDDNGLLEKIRKDNLRLARKHSHKTQEKKKPARTRTRELDPS